jgi:hypothetical protein
LAARPPRFPPFGLPAFPKPRRLAIGPSPRLGLVDLAFDFYIAFVLSSFQLLYYFFS